MNAMWALSHSPPRIKPLKATLFAGAIFLNGCMPVFHIGTQGDRIDGSLVEKTIDSTLGRSLKASNDKLTVEPSSCPDIVNVVNEAPARCSLTVNGWPLQIDVKPAPAPAVYQVEFHGSLYDMNSIGSDAQRNLMAMYGIDATVHCSGAQIRAYVPKERFTCSVQAVGHRSQLNITALQGGGYNVEKPGKLIAKSTDQWLRTALELHAKSRNVTIPGLQISKYINAVIGDSRAKLPQGTSLSFPKCPKTVNLSGTRTGECFVLLNGIRVPYNVSISPNAGIVIKKTLAIIDNVRVAHETELSLNSRLPEGFSGVTVDCGKGVRAAKPQSSFGCAVHDVTRSAVANFLILDESGEVRFTIGRFTERN